MSVYFFDLDDGRALFRDPEGVDLKDHYEAHSHAVTYLAEAAKELIPKGALDRKVEVRVRDRDSTDILTASIDFKVRFLVRSQLN